MAKLADIVLCVQCTFVGPQVLVVGDSGLGKTTLISSLLSKPGEQLQVKEGGGFWMHVPKATVECDDTYGFK
jgi:septin family protein